MQRFPHPEQLLQHSHAWEQGVRLNQTNTASRGHVFSMFHLSATPSCSSNAMCMDSVPPLHLLAVSQGEIQRPLVLIKTKGHAKSKMSGKAQNRKTINKCNWISSSFPKDHTIRFFFFFHGKKKKKNSASLVSLSWFRTSSCCQWLQLAEGGDVLWQKFLFVTCLRLHHFPQTPQRLSRLQEDWDSCSGTASYIPNADDFDCAF